MRQLKITQQYTNRESKSLDKYLTDISGMPMINADEEVELAIRIRGGDQVALQKLVNANLRFVVSVAKQYQNHGMPLGDIINEGNVGLIKAAERFDETRGFKFISYAVWWIRQSIISALADKSRLVRVPLNRIGTQSKISKAAAELEQKFEREPSADEIAQLLEMHAEDVESYANTSTRHLSLDAPLTADEDVCLLDMMQENDEPEPDMVLQKESLRKDLQSVLTVLTDREREVISYYYGLNGREEMSLEEICNSLELSRERVRQIKDKAVKSLRRNSHTDKLKKYLG